MDATASFQASLPLPSFVIRIQLPSGEATDWRIDSEISFHDVLDVLRRVMPSVSPTAFEYEDEDRDRITVRSDDELRAMIQWHQWMNSQRVCNGIGILPLLIYPRVSRSSGRRNMMGLTVDVDAAPTPQANRQGSGGGSSGRKQPGDIQNILSSGQIYQQDIEYLELMGFGNAGTVYRCVHIPTQRVMATKVIPLDVSIDVQRQIISELDILFQSRSPFIIGFYGAFFTERKISICTEYMDGGSLDNYGAIPEIVLARISVSVVKGLQYLWNLKVMHRDVKPSNMLVNTNGKVKICDFGVSIQLVNSIAKTYVGTNAYMAPERILGEEYGIHSDVWSLALSLVEMATGKFPYPSDSTRQGEDLRAIELLQCIVHEDAPKLSTQCFGHEFVDFISSCLSKAPQGRPKPEQLLEHEFIKKNDDGRDDFIASFYRNQYDHDVSIWSPQGRIFQIEYALEAVKQGSATVGLKSKEYAVLVALKRSSSELSSYQKKIIPIDDHVAVSIAGLTSDARLLSNFMRQECLNSRYVFDAPLPISRLVGKTGDKMQVPTMVYGRRPFGVGILIAGYDEQGPHILQLDPSANYFNCKAMSIGARSQSARTYLEKNLDKFADSSMEELVAHGLRSLRECLPSEQALNSKNCSLAVVGPDMTMKIYDNDDIAPFLTLIEETQEADAPQADVAMEGDASDQPADGGEARPETEGQEQMET
eukprot:Seg321.4 transcript_id=Seg321.4/GoldUCD/mRNA.D3Y31 product="Dual specificity mitogen-activated protein kinase kinase 5" protein_id=Seg321.4/GoldUCD/D3Y31